MKKMFRVLAVSVLGLFLFAGSAMALPSLPGGYGWVNAPFWTNTDLTTNVDGNSQFQLIFEGFTGTIPADASFGLFYVDNISNPLNPTRFEIFSRADEPATSALDSKTVSFKNEAGSVSISLDPNLGWTDFKKDFGFYFDFVHPTNPNNNGVYYSYFGLDTGYPADGVLNVFTAATANRQVLVILDRWPGDDAIQMSVYGNDLRPVPEPGTLLLLGSGLLGLVFYGRKRMKA